MCISPGTMATINRLAQIIPESSNLESGDGMGKGQPHPGVSPTTKNSFLRVQSIISNKHSLTMGPREYVAAHFNNINSIFF